MIETQQVEKTVEELQQELELYKGREQKLLEYVKYLISISSAMTVFITRVTDIVSWYYNYVEENDVAQKQKEILQFLESEYGIQYKVYGKKE